MRLSRRHVLAGSASLAGLTALAPRPGHAAGHVRSWRTYAEGGWGQIHIWMAEPATGPGDKTPLVCLHQSPTSGAHFKEFQPLMAKDRLVIAPDTPGYGGSTAPPSQPDMEDYGRAMVKTLNGLGYGPDTEGGPVDVLGFHTGTFVATEMAIQQPGLVRKLVMSGVPYYPPEEREEKRQQYGNPRPYFTDPDYMSRSYKTSVFNADDSWPKERRLEMFTERMRAGTKSHYGFDAVFRYDPDPVLTSLTQPTLLLILDETLTETTRVAAQMIPNATSIDLMDLPGTAWFTAPERLADVTRSFLDG